MIRVISTIGLSLSVVIALIGVLNFVNAVFTSIVSRKREFAMLQSIGMTTGQLKRVIICEGISYIAATGVLSLIVGTILSYAVLYSLTFLCFLNIVFRLHLILSCCRFCWSSPSSPRRFFPSAAERKHGRTTAAYRITYLYISRKAMN